MFYMLFPSVVCLTAGPQTLKKRLLYTVRSSASFFDFQDLLISLRPSSSCLRLNPRLPLSNILPPIFYSIKCFRKQFLRKVCTTPVILPSNYCMQDIPLLESSLIPNSIGPTDFLHTSPAPNLRTFSLFLLHFPKCPSFNTTQILHVYWFLPQI